MNNNNQIKSKLKIIKGGGIKPLLLDVVKYITEESGDSATDEEYARGVEKIVVSLKRRYEVELQSKPKPTKYRQKDLLEEIQDATEASKG